MYQPNYNLETKEEMDQRLQKRKRRSIIDSLRGLGYSSHELREHWQDIYRLERKKSHGGLKYSYLKEKKRLLAKIRSFYI